MKKHAFKVFAMGIVMAALGVGCMTDEDQIDPEVSTAESAVTVPAVNWVVANDLWLRATNSPAGPTLALMGHCTQFYVSSVDWNTRMAWGYSYQYGAYGYASIGNGSSVYLSVAGC